MSKVLEDAKQVSLESFFAALPEAAKGDYEALADADRTWGEDARREELERRGGGKP